jgi:hypothetical protein
VLLALRAQAPAKRRAILRLSDHLLDACQIAAVGVVACSTAVLHALNQYCNAVLGTEEKSTKASYIQKPELFNQLKRKENALGLRVGSFVGPEIGWTGSNEKANERNMLAHRFSVAPMMDWTD